MKRIYSLLLIFVILSSLVGCSAYLYEKEGTRYRDAAKAILISENICANDQDCMKKEIIFCDESGWEIGSWRSGGVTISLYSIKNSDITFKINEIYSVLHNEMPTVPVDLIVYKNSNYEKIKLGKSEILQSYHYETK